MRLNLGCGRAQFPIERGAKVVDHLAYFLPESAYTAEDWVNVDQVAQPGVDQVVDIFSYPWPWQSNSVDEIWCSHIVEHIPHEAKIDRHGVATVRGAVTVHGGYTETVVKSSSPELTRAADSDGFYAFFYEAWRVLKPDGAIHIVTPHAFSIAGASDPQHRRYITPATFSYLAKQGDDAPFDYQMPFAFAALGEPLLRTRVMEQLSDEELAHRMLYYNNFIDEIAISLRVVK